MPQQSVQASGESPDEPFSWNGPTMTTSTSNALAVIDGAKTTDEIARLLPPLTRAQLDFDRLERRAGVQNDVRRVGLYANAVATLEGLRNYADLRFELMDGTTTQEGADIRLNTLRQSAMAPAQRIEDEFSGVAQERNKEMVRGMNDMLTRDAIRRRR